MSSSGVKIQHASPTGPLDVPVLGRVVQVGEIVEAPASVAKLLLAQSDVWSKAGKVADDKPAEVEASPEGEGSN